MDIHGVWNVSVIVAEKKGIKTEMETEYRIIEATRGRDTR